MNIQILCTDISYTSASYCSALSSMYDFIWPEQTLSSPSPSLMICHPFCSTLTKWNIAELTKNLSRVGHLFNSFHWVSLNFHDPSILHFSLDLQASERIHLFHQILPRERVCVFSQMGHISSKKLLLVRFRIFYLALVHLWMHLCSVVDSNKVNLLEYCI